MREFRTSGSVGAPGGQPPGATRRLDIPGGYGKVPIGPKYFDAEPTTGETCVTDYCGERHFYRDGRGMQTADPVGGPASEGK